MISNKIYLYDGNFSTLIDLITKLLAFKTKPLNICAKNEYQPSLLDETIELELDNNFNINKIQISKNIIKTIYYIYLSNNQNKELIIYYFLLNALKYQDKIFTMRNLKCVDASLKISKYVSDENHKLKGFLRFQELENHILYAEISPTNNVLELLSIHFKKRLKNEYWIIKDVGRNMYSIYDKKKYYLISGNNMNILEIKNNEQEENIKKLWTTFFNTIGIKERRNKRCQMNFMPKKYWKYIIEMEGAYEKSNNR